MLGEGTPGWQCQGVAIILQRRYFGFFNGGEAGGRPITFNLPLDKVRLLCESSECMGRTSQPYIVPTGAGEDLQIERVIIYPPLVRVAGV